MSARTKPSNPSSRAGATAHAHGIPKTGTPFMSYPPAYVPTASSFNNPYGYCPTTNAAYTSSLYGSGPGFNQAAGAYFPTTNSDFGHKYMPITSASMYEYPYTSASMGDSPYMPMTSQSYYDVGGGDENDDGYFGTRSQYSPNAYTQARFGMNDPINRTGMSWASFYSPSDNPKLPSVAGPILRSHSLNNAARGALATGALSAAYAVGDGVVNRRFDNF